MTTFILFVLATIGLTNILVHGAILDVIKIAGRSVRQWMHYWKWSESLFNCYECTGTWAGFLCGWLIISTRWPIILACGFAGGLLSTWNNLLFEWINSKIEYIIDSGETNGTQEEHTTQD